VHQNIAVGTLQRRAGVHNTFAKSSLAVDLGCNGSQPRPAVIIGERMPGTPSSTLGPTSEPWKRPTRFVANRSSRTISNE
jgi:hypothetical protein